MANKGSIPQRVISESGDEVFGWDGSAGEEAYFPLRTAASRNVGPAPNQVPTGGDLDTQEGWRTHIWIPDKMRAEVEAATGGQCTVIYDDRDQPSIMRRIPRFRYEDLGYDAEFGTGTATAFDTGSGSIKSEILVGQFQASLYNGRACSLPGVPPARNIDWDDALAACTDKNNGTTITGWHLMTEHEWAAVALWCQANGFEPRGNTDHGRSHAETHEVGVRQDGDTHGPGDSSGIGHIHLGTGPVPWRHDNSMGGIADLVGNVWEWTWGLKLVDGQVHVAPNNDWTLAGDAWITMIDGNTHYVSNESGTPTLVNSGNTSVDANINVTWASLAKGGSYTESQTLQRMLFSPAGVYPQGRFFANTSGERLPLRGGARNNGSTAGLAAMLLTGMRGLQGGDFGFRPAYISA